MKTFKQAYDVLNSHAQALRDQSEPNIDDLLRIVNESVEAYKICQARIAAVDEALQAALKNTGQAAPGANGEDATPASARPRAEAVSRAQPAPPPRDGVGDLEDDIPF